MKAPGSSFLSSSIACSRVMFGLNQDLDVSITNFMVGCMSLEGPSEDVVRGVWLWLLMAGQELLEEGALGRTKSWCPGICWDGGEPGSGQPLISTMGMSTMELVMDGGQLLACSLASGGE